MKSISVFALAMLVAGCSPAAEKPVSMQTSDAPEAAVSEALAEGPGPSPKQEAPPIASAEGLIEEISDEELEDMAGGASCEGRDAAGRRVLYSEGNGLIRYKGETVNLTEDGIGGSELRSSGGPFLRVTLEKRPGKVVTLEEGSEQPMRMLLQDADGISSLDITYICGA